MDIKIKINTTFQDNINKINTNDLVYLYDINGNKVDNRVSNLRDVVSKENSKNRKLPRNNTSGAMGLRCSANLTVRR